MEVEKLLLSDKVWDLKVYKGFRLPPIYVGNVVDHLENLNSMVCRDDDVFLLAFPKSGAHFLRELINMLQKGKAEYISSDDVDSPIGVMTMDQINNMKSPRLLYQHIPFKFIPETYKYKKGKVSAVIRNPKDVCTSYFYFFKRIVHEVEWKEFFRSFMDGDLPYGKWFDWVKDWDKTLQENPDYPLLSVFYEDTKTDLQGQIRKISDFLELPCDEQLLNDIAKKCEFAAMKKGKSSSIPENVKQLSLDGAEPFFRKGVIGDWKNHLTVAENEEMDLLYEKETKNILNINLDAICFS